MYVDMGKRVSVLPNNKYLIFVTTFSYPESFVRAVNGARRGVLWQNPNRIPKKHGIWLNTEHAQLELSMRSV